MTDDPTGLLLGEMAADLPRWREALAPLTAVWADDVTIEPGLWTASTGARSADFNIVVCHDAPTGHVGSTVPAALDRAVELGVPCVLMVAGAALSGVQALVDAGWVCVGAAAYMAGVPAIGPADPRVERLDAGQFGEARALLETTFGFPPEMAEVALPERIAASPQMAVWALREAGELVSCVAACTGNDVMSMWSMATPPRHTRRGYGRALFNTMTSHYAERGVRAVIGSATPAGARLYSSVGFGVVEQWQLWSRRRWMFGR